MPDEWLEGGEGGAEWLRGEPERPRRAEPDEPGRKRVIPHPRLQCPFCEGYELKIQGTDFPIRHFKCRSCERAFQTYDSGPPPRKRPPA